MKKNSKGFKLIIGLLAVVVAIIIIIFNIWAALVPGLMDKTTDAKITSANKNAQNDYSAAQTMMQEAIIEEMKWVPSADITRVSSQGGAVRENWTDKTTLPDAIKMELGPTFQGKWLVAFDKNANAIYAVWSAKTTPSSLQLTEAQLKAQKGKVGCHPVKK